jgi:hypothetical protein
LELAERGAGLCDGFSGATGERLVPVGNGVRNEREEAEWLAVTTSAVTAAFPETVDELGQWRGPFDMPVLTKGTMRILS